MAARQAWRFDRALSCAVYAFEEDWGAEMNSAPQTPHLLFLDTGKRGELRSQPDNAASPESAGGRGTAPT